MEIIKMLIIPLPKKLEGKIKFIHNDVVARYGVEMTDEEKELLEKYREDLKEEFEKRFK